jgi:hypothetical protein
MAQPEAYDGVEIFPPIGISRAGDSSDYYLVSEDPDKEHPDGFTFRGSDGKIKPSAVTFHAYLYKDKLPTAVEATSVRWNLTWTVNVANKKAAWVRFKGKDHQETFRLRNPRVNPYPEGMGTEGVYEFTDTREDLIIRTEEENIPSGKYTEAAPKTLTGSFKGSSGETHNVDLGKIWTDNNGCLVFLAGTGESKCVKNITAHPDLLETFDNEDWYDNLCDGNVTVSVQPKAGNPDTITEGDSKLKTIVIAAPPKYTNVLYCPTSLHEMIEDVYERPRRFDRDYDCGVVYYDSDIKPIIDCAQLLSWTNMKVNEGHGPQKASRFPPDLLSAVPTQGSEDVNQPLRQSIFDRLRAPVRPDDPKKHIRQK